MLRFLIAILVFFLSILPIIQAQEVRISANGDQGTDGNTAPGYNPNPGSAYHNGRTGGDATSSTPASPGGTVELFLSDDIKAGNLQQANLTIRTLINGNPQPNQNLLVTSPGARLYVSAHGGKGGNGGIGGDGEGGQNGSKGTNASSHAKGTDGTSGYRGGANGMGTPGSNGGNGGKIALHLSTEDSYLSLLVSADVEGGAGGNSGRNGQVGSGGNGGPGGDSHDWETTEAYLDTETYYVDVPYDADETYSVDVNYKAKENYTERVPYQGTEEYQEDYTALESNRNGSYKTVTKHRTKTRPVTKYRDEPRTRTVTKTRSEERHRTVTKYRSEPRLRPVTRYKQVPHHNDGGSYGPNGNSGNYRNGNTSAGERGKDGSYQILVTDAEGATTTYQSSSNLRLVSYDTYDKNGDGVIEPGEKVIVSKITVQNVGQMQSPSPKSNAIVFLKNSKWILAEPVSLQIPELKSGESYTFSKNLSFKVRDFPDSEKTLTNQRWQTQDEIIPAAEVTRIQYTYDGFRLPKTLTITYPVEITPFEGPTTVGVGQTIPMLFKIRNISNIAYGTNTDSKRALTVEVSGSGSGANAESITSFGSTTGTLSKGTIANFANLGPQETLIVQGTLQISPLANPYSTIEMKSSLGLDRFLKPTEGTNNHTILQQHSVILNVRLLYNRKPESKVLLITNSSTSRDEYLAWQILLQKLGLTFDVWDLAYYNSLNFLNPTEGSDTSLAQDFAGKTIIVLNSALKDSSQTTTDAFIKSSEFLELTQKNKIRFYVVGGDSENTLTQLLTPKNLITHQSLTELVDALRSDEDCRSGHCLEIKGHRYTIGTDDTAQSVLDQVQKTIHECLPSDRFCVNFTPNERIIKKGHFTHDVSFGQLTINKISKLAPTGSQGRAVFISLKSEELHNANFINGDENFRGILLAMDFDSKLELTKTLRAGSDNRSRDLLKILVDNLMLDAITTLDYLLHSEQAESVTELPNNVARLMGPDSPDSVKLGSGIGLFLKVFKDNTPASAMAKTLWDLYSSGQTQAQKEGQRELEKKLQARAAKLVNITPLENVRHMLCYPGLYRAHSTQYLLAPGNDLEMGR